MARVSDAELFARPIVITNAEFRFVVAEQLRDRSVAADIVLEPMRRGSGPAVAVSAVLATERDADALVLVLAADHVIGKLAEFRAACRLAAQTAAQGRIITFGIPPTCAATHYGYIRPGEPLNGDSVLEVEAFVEKPMRRRNNVEGNREFRAAHGASREGGRRRDRDLDFLRLASEPFARAPKKSIDYAVRS
jgi:mannose-1-phosphate guanylyltransferase/mannose-6-phosphate isomerase